MSVKPKVKIDIHEWMYNGATGFIYGTAVTVNGTRLSGWENDYESMLVKVLECLGYEVELNVKVDEE